MNNWNIEYWLTEQEINRLNYSTYWNDEECEKEKEWYILDGDFLKMEQYLKRMGLPEDLVKCAGVLKNRLGQELSGVGIDLAAGNLWSVSHLFKLGKINKLFCLEFSKHRLLKIGPSVLEHYGIPKEKIILVLGSFYDLHIGDQSLDFIFLSQAFHHADDPNRLLLEIRRVLKPMGTVIIIGEHIVNHIQAYSRYIAKFLISRTVHSSLQRKLFGKILSVKSFIPKPEDLFPTDPILGDHFYTNMQYKRFFLKHGFKSINIRNKKSIFQSFVLIKK